MSEARGSWPDQAANIVAVVVTFLLPLKFGTLAAMPETSIGLPGDLFSAAIVSWTAHAFGIVSGSFLIIMLLLALPRRGILRGGGAVVALLWGGGLIIASLPGWINAPLFDYAQGETAHLAGVGAYVLAVWLWLAGRPDRCRIFWGALAAGTFCTGLSGLRQYFFGFDEMKEYLAAELASGKSIPWPLQAKILDSRVFATFVSCNALAGYLLLTIPLAGVAFYRFGRHFDPPKLSARLLGGGCVAVLVSVLLMTRSRGAFLAALIAVGGWLLTRPFSRRCKIALLLLTAAAIVAGGVYIELRGRGFLSAGER
ncbi:MAG: hypothetical protein PHI35_02355, partial [Victivallaceae bacterium]|nr:hypothetical protein [Victivallaceae bacterium]